jgi:hypothetical protein
MSEDLSEYLANACNVGNVSYYPAVAMLDGWVLGAFLGEQLAEFEVKCLHCIPSGRPAPLGWGVTCTTAASPVSHRHIRMSSVRAPLLTGLPRSLHQFCTTSHHNMLLAPIVRCLIGSRLNAWPLRLE